MAWYPDIAGVILAGGKSSRFGSNKAFARFQQTPFVQKILRVLQGLFADVVLVTNTPEDYLSLPIKVLVDNQPYQGPLGGIATALQYSVHRQIFVVACDMPLINPEVIREIVDHGRSYDAAIPVHEGQPEYLLALYSKQLLPKVESNLHNDILSLQALCRDLESIAWIPIKGETSFNVNTTQDLKELENRYAV